MAFNTSTLHISVPLTDLAVAYRPEEDGYLWSTLLPPKIVTKRTDLIRQIDKGNLLRWQDLRTGKAGRVQEVQFKVGSNLTFNAIDYAVEAVLRNTERAEADEILQYDQENIYHCLIAMHTNLEIVTIKQTLRDPTVLTNNVSLTSQYYWDNYSSPLSDPVDDIITGINQVFVRTGHMPNQIVMHALVWDRVQRHPLVLARGGVHPTGNAIVTVEQFERICRVDPGTLKITAQQYNNALEDQTPNFVSMIGPDCIITYSEAPSIRSYGIGYSYMFQDSSAGGNDSVQAVKEIEAPFLVYEFPDNGQKDPRGATIHRLVGGLDQKVQVTDAGYLIQNCVDKTAPRYAGYLNN
jgi:hypothetical protein